MVQKCLKNHASATSQVLFHFLLGGEDGKSSNNCTLRGGQIQLITGGSSLQKVEVINVLIQGITFVAGLGASVVLVSAGDVTFVDCIFKVSSHCKYLHHSL